MSAAVTRRAFLGRTSALAFGALYPGILRVATALPLSAQGPRKRVHSSEPPSVSCETKTSRLTAGTHQRPLTIDAAAGWCSAC